MYPIVEFLTGLLFLATYYTFGFTVPAFKFLALGCLLLVLIITDIRVRLLPDAVNWFGFGLALAFAMRVPPGGFVDFFFPGRLPSMLMGVLDALIGAAFGSLLLWGAAAFYKLVRKREGMGMGDVKMMAMVGAFLGIRGAFLTILFGTLMGSIVGIAIVLCLFFLGAHRALAERAARRGLGTVRSLRWFLATQYQLPLGTFLGIAALFVVYGLPWLGIRLDPLAVHLPR